MRRATVYFDESLHKALRIKSMESDKSLSDLVNEAVRQSLEEDHEDLEAIAARKNQKTVSYEAFLKELRGRGQI